MGWQRFNRTSRVFEVSDDNGASWQTLKISAAGTDAGALPGNLVYTDRANTWTGTPQVMGSYFYVNTAPAAGDASIFLQNQASTPGRQNFRIMSYADMFRIWNADNGINLLTLDPASYALATSGDVNVGTDAFKGNLYSTYPIYPGRQDTGWTKQTSWYLGSIGTYGLYTNTGMYLEGICAPNYIEARAHIRAAGGLYDFSRGYPIGDWIDWTPAFYDSGGTPCPIAAQYTTRYTLIGHTCIVTIHVSLNIPSNGAQFIWMSLPATAAAYTTSVWATNDNYPAGTTSIFAVAYQNTTQMYLFRTIDGGGYWGQRNGVYVCGEIAYSIS